MPVPPETCQTCRFDGARYGLQDTLGTLRALGPMWAQTTEGLDEPVLLARPAPGAWSVAEHAAHSARVVEVVGHLFATALEQDRPVLAEQPAPVEPDVSDGTAAALARLTESLRALHGAAAAAGGASGAAWTRTIEVEGAELDTAWLVRHAVHDATHHLSDAGRTIHRLGAGAPTDKGAVTALHVSAGGLPKLPIGEAEVGVRGLVGDRQATRQHHGKPLQALCLWSREVIEALQAEGHPIAPGLAGENVTVEGLDWAAIRPGVQVVIGDVLAEISAYAVPCKQNARWYTGGDFNRMSQDRHPGWSRVYAWVREPGTIRTDDVVIVEP